MTYYINPIFFYLMGVADGIKTLGWILLVGAPLTLIAIVPSVLVGIGASDDDFDKVMKKSGKIVLPLAVIGLVFAVFVPSKDTVKEMMIASVVTEERVDATVEDVKGVVDYIFEKVNDHDGGKDDNS